MFRTPGMGRAEFVLGQFTIMVLVERFQSGNRIGDFAGVDNSIMIDVEGRHDGGLRRTPLVSLRASGTIVRRRIAVIGWTTGRTTIGRTTGWAAIGWTTIWAVFWGGAS